MIVRLIKSLYGLRQAPKLWYHFFAGQIAKFGFRCSSEFDCLFIRTEPTLVFIVVYLDDLPIIGTNSEIASVKSQLENIFTVTDLGLCSYLFVISIIRKHGGIFLSQQSYTAQFIKAAGTNYCAPAKSPLSPHHPLYGRREPLTR